MAEIDLIERKAVYKALDNIGGCGATDDWAKGYDAAIDAAICIVENTPAADIELVKHGHWVGYETKSYKNSENGIAKKYYRCSSCRYFNAIRSNYCPNCGAKMDDKN